MNMKLLAAIAAAALATPLHAQLIGPSTYQSSADSPFNGLSFTYFYLEDVEDNAINTPGLGATGSGICIAGFNCFVGGNLTDSVGNGGDGTLGRSVWASGSITVTFDAAILGALPTAAGLVWTDGLNSITFEAFDQNGVSLGTLTGDHADGAFTGGTEEDRFYGVFNGGGISRLVISNPSGIEVDHIQYGLLSQIAGIPEPRTWALMLLGFGAVGCAMRRRRPHLALRVA